MEPFYININLNSIKKNADAGSSQTHINKGWTWTVCGTGEILSILKDAENCYITNIDYDFNNNIKNYTAILFDDSLVDALFGKKNIQLKAKANYISINHFPIPLYIYGYEDAEVTCYDCGKSFNHKELKNINDDECYNDKVCPYCSVWDCCEIEYETIENALRRKNI
jgi:DNA-directed RNA polymerase subunit RPC12/RpoP